MSSTLKITVVGGEKNGFEMSFDCSRPVLVGRSRSADLHLPEPDVSGKHFSFVSSGAGCDVKILSRNGLVVDGRQFQCGDTAHVQANSLIEIGMRAKVRVDAVNLDAIRPPQQDAVSLTAGTVASVDATFSAAAPVSGGDASPAVAVPQGAIPAAYAPKPDDSEAETAPDPPAPVPEDIRQLDDGSPAVPPSLAGGVDFANEETSIGGSRGDSLTSAAADGETQEMKTRVGSLEEIIRRKHQLDRTNFHRRVRGILLVGLFVTVLGVAGYFFGWKSHVIDIDGPYLPDGSFDNVQMDLLDENGMPEFYLDYPRNDAMTVNVSADSNLVEIASWFGKNNDVPFHMEFLRWNDRADLMRSLEVSFERWMLDETAKGSAFQTHSGNRPKGEFLEDAFPAFIQSVNDPAFQTQALRGMRFVRVEHTRSRDGSLWRGNCIYFRKGDRIHLLRLEIPDLYWNIAKVRVSEELHLGIYEVFSRDYWDSPGTAGIVDDKFSDDDLISRVKHEFSAERVAAWPDIAAYIDTLLVRSWGDKPRIQKEAMSFYLLLQEQMSKFYREREFAFATARANGDDKRMKSIRDDCKTAFGLFPRDRRRALINNPEVW